MKRSEGSLAWFPFYPCDFSMEVSVMTQAEVGAYVRLLCCAWSQEPPGTLPSDPAILANIAGGAVSATVLGAFRANGDRLECERLVRIASEQRGQYQRRSDAGRRGGFAKATRGNAVAMPEQCQSNALARASGSGFGSDSGSKSDSERPTETQTNAKPAPVDYPAARIGLSGAWPLPVIDAILAEYPAAGRTRPMRARRAVDAALDALRERGGPSPDSWLLGRVRDYAKSPLGRAGMYAGSAADWFEQGRYDEPPEAWARTAPTDRKPDHGAGTAPGPNGTGAMAKAMKAKAEFEAAWAGKEPPKRSNPSAAAGNGG